jgi:large subunit ribosomal protein L1
MAEAKKTKKTVEAKDEIKDGTIQEDNQTATETDQKPEVVKATAKAGKRSTKAVKEAEEKQTKEARKAEAPAEEKPVVRVQKTARPRIERQGKNFRRAAELVEREKQYSLLEALDLAIKTSPVKFDATVELHVNLNVDPRQAEQNIRETVVLPAGTGKRIRIAALTEDIEAAKAAGADIAGNDDLFAQFDKGVLDFDVLIATPALMPKLGKYARVLGPKGLMPSPKSGTVSPNVAKAIKEAKAGKVEFRVDSTGIIHLGIGKVSFGTEKLEQNARAVMGSLKAAKPASIKGTYVKNITIASSMGPGIRVLTSEL